MFLSESSYTWITGIGGLGILELLEDTVGMGFGTWAEIHPLEYDQQGTMYWSQARGSDRREIIHWPLIEEEEGPLASTHCIPEDEMKTSPG